MEYADQNKVDLSLLRPCIFMNEIVVREKNGN